MSTGAESTLPVTATLEGWCLGRAGRHYFLLGHISGDRWGRWPDGDLISTSALRNSAPQGLQPGCVAETLNSRYRLGARAARVSLQMLLYAASLGGHPLGPDGEPVTQVPEEAE